MAACMLSGDGLPAVRRMYNLYHPFDPVAYRMEPLIVAGAEKRRPVYAVRRKLLPQFFKLRERRHAQQLWNLWSSGFCPMHLYWSRNAVVDLENGSLSCKVGQQSCIRTQLTANRDSSNCQL